MTALRTRHPWPGFGARSLSFPIIIPNGGHSPFIPSSPSVTHARPHVCPHRVTGAELRSPVSGTRTVAHSIFAANDQ